MLIDMGDRMLAKIVVIYEGEPKERRFAVRDSLADELIKVLEERKRFWEWEEEIALLSKMNKAFMNREDSGIDYRVLLKKYMRHITACESVTFVNSCACTEDERQALKEIQRQIYDTH